MKYYQITDAAKKLDVESHVLRYWEEELELPIERNKQGHRLYTEEDLQRFRYIKELKKEGLQLRAIRMKVHKAEDWAKQEYQTSREEETQSGDAQIVETLPEPVRYKESRTSYEMSAKRYRSESPMDNDEREEKAVKLCMMLQQMVGQAVRKENQEMLSELKRSVAETVSKEMDYQFRMQEQRDEAHYQRIDELLREKSGRKNLFQGKNDKDQQKTTKEQEKTNKEQEKAERKHDQSQSKSERRRRKKKTRAELEKEMLMENKRKSVSESEKKEDTE